jgi:DUF4097 and DUF4098 domain-containing protein YvlB
VVKRINNAVLMALVLGVSLASAAQPGAERSASGPSRVYREGRAWVEEIAGTLPASRTLRVVTEVGSVQVQGGGQGITYVIKKRAFTGSEDAARREFESFRINAARQGEADVLRGEWVSGSRHQMSAEFLVQVPRELDLVKVETRGGSVAVNNVAGRVEGETAGGGIQMDAIGGNIVASTMGGNISIGAAGSEALLKSAGGGINVASVIGRLTATTYGGDLAVGTVKQSASLETMGGSIRIRQSGGDLRASTAGGNIEAGDVGGSVVLKTAGGSIRLGSARGPVQAATAGGGISLWKLERGVRAETAAGGITAEFTGQRGNFTESSLETTAGDITVYLPASLACSIRAAIQMASGHKITSEFKEIRITTEGSEFGPKEWYAQGTINGGGPVLKLRTSIGDIDIRRGR